MIYSKKIKIGLSLFFIIFMVSPSVVCAQAEMNWIEKTQNYVKITVPESGVYQISYQEIKDYFPFPTLIPTHFQMFFLGKEIPIKIIADQDNRLDVGDKIEWMAVHNKAQIDELMYTDKSFLTQPEKGMYEDKAYYFLTYSPQKEGKRILLQEIPSTPLPIQKEYIKENMSFEDGFSTGKSYPDYMIYEAGAVLADFSSAKGFTDKSNTEETFIWKQVKLTHPISMDRTPEMDIFITGRINMHYTVEIFVSLDKEKMISLGEISGSEYENKLFTTYLPQELTGKDGFWVGMKCITPAISNPSISFIECRYVTEELFFKENTMLLSPKNDKEHSFEVKASQPKFYLFNKYLTYLKPLSVFLETGKYRVEVPQSPTQSYILGVDKVFTPEKIEPISFTTLDIENKNYIILTHESFFTPFNEINVIDAYAAYRSSSVGGNHKVFTITTETIWNYFGYGFSHPQAMHNFVQFLAEKGYAEYLFIIGKGLQVQYKYFQQLPQSLDWKYQNRVPCFGSPCSDYALLKGIKKERNFALAIGRLSANRTEDVFNYLEKVKEYESVKKALYQKNILHLNGGVTLEEHKRFRGFVKSYEAIVKDSYLGADIVHLSKKTTDKVEFLDITENINKGLKIINFFGHSSLTKTDLEIGYPSNPNLNFKNKGMYPLVIGNGCNAGNFYENVNSMGEDWLLTPNKGAILFLAHAHLGLDNIMNSYMLTLYEVLFKDRESVKMGFGKILQKTRKLFLEKFPNEAPLAEAQVDFFLLQGDPSIQIFDVNQSDYQVLSSQLFLKNFDSQTPITADVKKIQLGIPIENLGIKSKENIDILLKWQFPNGKMVEKTTISPAIDYKDTIFIALSPTDFSDDFEGLHKFEVFLDVEKKILEANKENNRAKIEYVFESTQVQILYPNPFSILNKDKIQIHLKQYNPLNTQNKYIEKEYVLSLDTLPNFDTPFLKKHRIKTRETYFDWTVDLQGIRDTTAFYFRVEDIDRQEEKMITFAYIESEEQGWGQVHFPQFEDNLTSNIKIDLVNSVWQRVESQNLIREARIDSSILGPAKTWKTLFLQITQPPTFSGIFYVDIIGINTEGKEELLMKNLKKQVVDIQSIDAEKYPFLFLKLYIKDTEGVKNPLPQLKKWFILYEKHPDLLLTLSHQSKEKLLDVKQYDEMVLDFELINISDAFFTEPLQTQFELLNFTTHSTYTFEKQIDEPLPFVKKTIPFVFSATDWVGKNKLTALANTQYLAEKNYKNNSFQTLFDVEKDELPPVLYVTVDGNMMADNSFIPKTPTISIDVFDDAPMELSSIHNMLFLWGVENNMKQIDLSLDDRITIKSIAENRFKIFFTPELTPAVYEMKVQASDKNENISEIYHITGRVTVEYPLKYVRYFYPTPNPFSNELFFHYFFELQKIPDSIEIYIFSMKGKLVAKLDNTVVGDFSIGEHITEGWTPVDEQGNPLPTGIYLYQIIIQDKKLFSFKKNGKLVLTR